MTQERPETFRYMKMLRAPVIVLTEPDNIQIGPYTKIYVNRRHIPEGHTLTLNPC